MKDRFFESAPSEKLKRLARFKEERRRVTELKESLCACSRWTHSEDLAAALDDTLRDIDALVERLEEKAVVAFVGGSGTGKSSLVNALCGRPDVVRAGVSRPTTRKGTAVVRSVPDARFLVDRLESNELDVLPVPETELPGAVLVDAPDTDSTECESYSRTLDLILENADVLVCVFDATNPKRKDNFDRLARTVAKFQGRHVALVLNHADLVVPERLQDTVVPDFKEHLGQCWPGIFEHVYCTAAAPGADVSPDFKNGLADLAGFLRSVSGKNFADERVARAAFLRTSAEDAVRSVVGGQGDWAKLALDVRTFENAVANRFADRYSRPASGARPESAETALLRAVTPRWWGPVGLYLGFSRRFRRFVETPFRLSDLVLPLGILRRVKAFADSDGPHDLASETPIPSDVPELRPADLDGKSMEEYATLSDRMVRDFGMSASLRDPSVAFSFSDLSGSLNRSWAESREEAVLAAARRCCGFFFQFVLNACTIVPAGYVLWISASTFLKGDYLPGAFYRHGLFLLALLWLLTSWLVQIRLNAAARTIPIQAAGIFAKKAHSARILPVVFEIERLAGLASR